MFLTEQMMMPEYNCVDINVELVLATHRQCLLVDYLGLTDNMVLTKQSQTVPCYRLSQPDLSPVNFSLWEAPQQKLYCQKTGGIDCLKQVCYTSEYDKTNNGN